MNVYMSGSLVRVKATFTDFDGALADPTTTTAKYKAGAGSVTTTNSPVHDSLGVFHIDIDTTGWTGPGNLLYTVQFSGTGNVQAIEPDYFEVEPAAL